jgi:membrane protein CcdC involved in cytochrome C biogenesis
MNSTLSTALLVVLLVSSSVWLGGYTALAVVMLAARASLPAPEKVKFFRALGRNYMPVGSAALVLMILSGGALLWGRPFDWLSLALVLTALAVVVVLAVAVVQARRLTVLRQKLVTSPDDAVLAATVTRVGRAAVVLRALLGVLSLLGVVFAALAAG